MRAVKFTTHLPGMTLYGGGDHWWKSITTDQIVHIARELDRLDYDYITLTEHLYMHPDFVPQFGPRWTHSLSAAGFVLGATQKIRVVCLVVVPYHGAIELAKALASLDFLSGGRLVCLALTGYQEWEFATLRVPFSERGRMTDEYVDAMRELWTSDRPRFDGKFVSFDDVVFEPKPIQQPLPIWMGGRTHAALRRVARRGDAWISYMTRRAEVPAMLEYLYAQPEVARRATPLEISLPLYEGERDPVTHVLLKQPRVVLQADRVVEQARTIAALGATVTDADAPLGTSVFQNDRDDAPPPTKSFADYLERIQWFAEEVMPSARAIEGDRAVALDDAR
jgi:probable F420-dependent oxidoreductase